MIGSPLFPVILHQFSLVLNLVVEEKRNELLEKVFHLKQRGFTFKQIANSVKIAESTANRYYHEYIKKNETKRA